ncbi:MAG: DUF4157 domain-containing protein [Acidobacteriota bacterium]
MVATLTNKKAKTAAEGKPQRTDAATGKDSPEPNPVWQSLALSPKAIQRKLAVSQADGPYEREADRIADPVMHSPEPQMERAYTSDDGRPSRDTVFGLGRYEANSIEGPHLLGHELAQVVQQRAGQVQPTAEMKGAALNDDSALDAEADSASEVVALGVPAAGLFGLAAGSARPGVVQRQETKVAARGLGGAGATLPHLDRIQASFGRHDVTGARAHLGPEAADSNRRMGAEAYTFGDRVAFAGVPSLHTAAHEAAHVVQQQSGVDLKNNVGDPGDAYERHADAVAVLVVQGRPASRLLDQMAGSAESQSTGTTRAGLMPKAAPAVQMQPKAKPKSTSPQMPLEIPGLRESIAKWAALDKIKEPIIRALAKEYVNRPGRLKIPDRVVRDTPYGGDKVIPGTHEPTEDRVYYALSAATNLKKIGKGDKATDWSFKWVDEPAPEKKTAGEKGMEIGKFAAEQAISKTIDKKFAIEEAAKQTIEKKYITKQLIYNAYQKSAANLGVVGAESLMTGQISGTSIAEAITEPVARWIMKDVLLVSAEVVTRAIPIIGWLWLAYDVADLLISLNEPAEKELSPYQTESANIVAGVKAYLEGKQKAAELQEALNKPFDPYKNIKPLQNDATIVRPWSTRRASGG